MTAVGLNLQILHQAGNTYHGDTEARRKPQI